jgi:hypothetical protein
MNGVSVISFLFVVLFTRFILDKKGMLYPVKQPNHILLK